MRMTDGWFEKADVAGSLPTFELHSGIEGLETYASKNEATKAVSKQMYSSMLSAPKWLPFAAEAYHTSKDSSDYFLVPTIIMPSDLPNRNGAAFPLAELTKFQPHIGDLAYNGWKGKPVHVEHRNTDPTQAIGAVVDVSLKKMGNTGMWKVLALMAIDRTKNLPITNAILKGDRKNYSMGAMVRGHSCSICGERSIIKPSHKTRYDGLKCGMSHSSMSRNNDFRVFDQADGSKKLGFLNVIDITPIEISSVAVPAYVSADSELNHLMTL